MGSVVMYRRTVVYVLVIFVTAFKTIPVGIAALAYYNHQCSRSVVDTPRRLLARRASSVSPWRHHRAGGGGVMCPNGRQTQANRQDLPEAKGKLSLSRYWENVFS